MRQGLDCCLSGVLCAYLPLVSTCRSATSRSARPRPRHLCRPSDRDIKGNSVMKATAGTEAVLEAEEANRMRVAHHEEACTRDWSCSCCCLATWRLAYLLASLLCLLPSIVASPRHITALSSLVTSPHGGFFLNSTPSTLALRWPL